MIAVKTDDAIYMNVDSFFVGDELSTMGEGLYLECDDGFSVKVIDCNKKQAKSLLGDIAKAISLYLVSSGILVFDIHDGVISRIHDGVISRL